MFISQSHCVFTLYVNIFKLGVISLKMNGKRDDWARRFEAFKTEKSPESPQTKTKNQVSNETSIKRDVSIKAPASPPKTKIPFPILLEKLGIRKNEFGKYRARKKFVVIVSILLAVFIITFAMGGFRTGFTISEPGNRVSELQALLGNNSVYIDELEKKLGTKEGELNLKQAELISKQEEVSSKTKELDSLKSQLDTKESKIDELENELSDLNSKNNETSDEIEKLKEENEKLADKQDDVEDVIKSTVRNYCCSVNDIQKGSIVKWEVNNGGIVCEEGKYNINCGTSSVNFFD